MKETKTQKIWGTIFLIVFFGLGVLQLMYSEPDQYEGMFDYPLVKTILDFLH